MGLPRWEVAGKEMGIRILPHDMGLPSRSWDFQDGKWQITRWEALLSTGDMTSKMGSGR